MLILKSLKSESGPVFKNEFYEKDGYSFEEIEEWEVNGETFYDVGEWVIYPDGTFFYYYDSEVARFYNDEEGTFDSSKYEDFVNQMKNHQTDWQDELSYYDKYNKNSDVSKT